MTYRFAGFLATSRQQSPSALPPGAAWREITDPFEGSGVRLPELVGKAPDVETIRGLANALGFSAMDTWLYLTYDGWGGRIDFVYGYGQAAGAAFGPVEEEAPLAVEEAFVSLMAKLGLTAREAMQFPPFKRGFWGET